MGADRRHRDSSGGGTPMTFGNMLAGFVQNASPSNTQMQELYGEQEGFLFVQANDFNKIAKFYYTKAEDSYYKANDAASYDDWRKNRRHWMHFFHKHIL